MKSRTLRSAFYMPRRGFACRLQLAPCGVGRKPVRDGAVHLEVALFRLLREGPARERRGVHKGARQVGREGRPRARRDGAWSPSITT